jgi:hypothetical protein
MKTRLRLIVSAVVFLTIGGVIGYGAGRKSADRQLTQSARALSLAHAAKETAIDTRLLEGLRDGKTDVVIERLEALLDGSITNIGMCTESNNAPDYVTEAVSRSLCLARNYRQLYPHRPTHALLAKYYDAALAEKVESH